MCWIPCEEWSQEGQAEREDRQFGFMLFSERLVSGRLSKDCELPALWLGGILSMCSFDKALCTHFEESILCH